MDKNFPISEEKVKNSFYRVKNHISKLENETKDIKRKVEEISLKLAKFISSIGNDGVAFRRRQSVDKESTKSRQEVPFILPNTISPYNLDQIKEDIDTKFRALTDKQFSIFMAIYQLEEELNQPVSYILIADKLKLSQSVIRDYISELMLKKIPLIKIKQNNKIYLSIPQEFRELSLASKLVKFRQLDRTQATLFDKF